MSNITFYSLIVLAGFNIFVNLRLLLSPLFSRFQKISLSIIIWVLPVLGGAFVYYLETDTDRDPPPPGAGPGSNYGGDSMAGVQ